VSPSALCRTPGAVRRTWGQVGSGQAEPQSGAVALVLRGGWSAQPSARPSSTSFDPISQARYRLIITTSSRRYFQSCSSGEHHHWKLLVPARFQWARICWWGLTTNVRPLAMHLHAIESELNSSFNSGLRSTCCRVWIRSEQRFIRIAKNNREISDVAFACKSHHR